MKTMKLTEPQIRFLEELANDATISLCVEPGASFGELIGKNNFSGNIQKKSLFKLTAMGLIIFDLAVYYGIRYMDCHLSAKGLDILGGERV